jgi:glutamate racemase
MQRKPTTLAIFDSGVGGLSLVKRLEAGCSTIDYRYYADTAFLPYGDKSPAQIRERVAQVVQRLLRDGADALVVACNTADAVALPSLVEELPVPVFRLIDSASQAAVEGSIGGRIGVLSTQLTAESGAYQSALLRGGAQWVHSVACPRLVPLIEESPSSAELEDCVRGYLEPLVAGGMDTLILGCTHFALITSLIERWAGPQVKLIDPAQSSAQHVLQWLGKDYQGQASQKFLVSGDPQVFRRRAARSRVVSSSQLVAVS